MYSVGRPRSRPPDGPGIVQPNACRRAAAMPTVVGLPAVLGRHPIRRAYSTEERPEHPGIALDRPATFLLGELQVAALVRCHAASGMSRRETCRTG